MPEGRGRMDKSQLSRVTHKQVPAITRAREPDPSPVPKDPQSQVPRARDLKQPEPGAVTSFEPEAAPARGPSAQNREAALRPEARASASQRREKVPSTAILPDNSSLCRGGENEVKTKRN